MNEAEDGQTPLQACVLNKKQIGSKWMGIETAELLILNGAKVDESGNSQSVLDIALLGNAESDMMQYLMARIS
jgi:ankyrin repeat protein